MRLIFALLLVVVSTCSLAETLHAFKLVHADGTVSYSDTQAGNEGRVEMLSIQQDNAAIERQGEQRLQQIDGYNQDVEKKRAADAKAGAEYQKRVDEARQEVAEAQRNLVAAQQSKKNSSPARIQVAQQHLRLARQRLREVQGGAP